jgi:hypothetical protein
MGANIRKEFFSTADAVVVAHPTLVGILKGKPGLVYQHGEVITPEEALVSGAETVIVPTEEAFRPFEQFGYEPESLFISGLCIEPALVSQANDAFHERLGRIQGDESLTGAFFSSGAEPRPHLEKLTAAAVSVAKAGHRVIIFARRDGNFAGAATNAIQAERIELSTITSRDQIPGELPPALIILSSSRREESIFTAKLFPWFDYSVAPPHERSNWALGLGLPIFSPEPCIGPFAPLNRDFLLSHGVVQMLGSIEEARGFAELLSASRSEGRLSQMAQAGWGRFGISGFDKIAEFLARKFAGQVQNRD